ncbi:phospholipase A2 inhibitor gamma subunit B-like [Elgaria multicarinata webbii]|uniref:phospholipase A2 inhibitor gamma subunit B-like n=1 Tax=Elgaria multicarinata webbii TaxID=159646 RepID=UPI002FCD13CD
MRFFLACCLLGALLATGTCLECPSCIGHGSSCSGDMITCDADEDTCIIQLKEFTQLPTTLRFINKGCSKSSTCKHDVAEANLGRGFYLRSRRVCCIGDECNNILSPVLPPPDTKPNGYHCPGCAGVFSSKCHAESVPCVGSQNQCTELAGNFTGIFLTTEFGVKACATEAFCAMSAAGIKNFAHLGVAMSKQKCIPASKIST